MLASQMPSAEPARRHGKELKRLLNEAKAQMAMLNVSNTDADTNFEQMVEDIYYSIVGDRHFCQKYALPSLFMVGLGAFGCVFRAVTCARGGMEHPKYPTQLVKHLQRIYRTTKVTRQALVDAYRSEHCLDLVAVKFEHLTQQDLETNAIGKVNLVREFYLLTELFRDPDSRYSMVGFPLPIDFGYTGNNQPSKSLSKIIVYNPHGAQDSYKETYLGKYNIFGLEEHNFTLLSYMSMELVGPNLDEWKTFFARTRSSVYFSVQTVLKLMDQVLCRLLVMHRKNIVHLDLKPDNICLGIDKMVNTVYLLDFGLSKICSSEKPDITFGSRRYMSVGVLNFQPANYIMDIESWFYVLIVLLTDYIPWSDEEQSKHLQKDEKEGGAREEKLQSLVSQSKKTFWNDNQYNDKSVLQCVIKSIEDKHKADVPDIVKIIMDLYEHVKRMRQDFYRVNYSRMNADIKDEESDLFKRYKALRKLLLFVYDCDFTGKGCCFTTDKDLHRKQEERRMHYPMLVYAKQGRDWQWDWDEWFAEDYPNDNTGL